MKLKKIKNISIKARLIISFDFIIALTLVIAIFSGFSLRSINNATNEISNNCIPSIRCADSIKTDISQYRISVLAHIISKSTTEMQSLEEKLKSEKKNIEDDIAKYETLVTNDVDKQLINKIEQEFNEYLKVSESVLSYSNNHETEQAIDLSNREGTVAFNKVTDSLLELTEFNKKYSDTATKNANKRYSITLLVLIIVNAFALVISVMLSFVITNSIVKPVKKITVAADKLAVGDLNVELDIDTKDEIGHLAKSFESLIASTREQALAASKLAEGDMTVEIAIRSENDLLGQKLSEMVAKNNEALLGIVSAAEQVDSGSKQISDSSIALSQGATEQASAVEELTASLEEISSQTKLNAENAYQANELTENARLNAIQGNSHMKGMLKAMEDINKSSSNISKIIKVIDDIAFQTNMLALNAAVEAARAGQHGKGFAVVAEEVKNLAARSANAAKETTDMIESSIKKSDEGTKIAKETAEALNKIVDQIEKVADIVSNINIASNEQAIGIEQINQGIMQVSQVVQTNSATAEETAAASEELSNQASIMSDMATKYKLKNNTKNYENFEGLSPEILNLLNNMSEKRKMDAEINHNSGTQQSKILLSDNEFGKY